MSTLGKLNSGAMKPLIALLAPKILFIIKNPEETLMRALTYCNQILMVPSTSSQLLESNL